MPLAGVSALNAYPVEGADEFPLPAPVDAEAHLFRYDEHGRMHVLAKIDGQGPFDMLLDTGAGR